MIYMLGKREVVDVTLEFEFGEGAYVTGGTFLDDETDLDDDQCEALTDAYQAELYQEGYERAACDAYDRAKGD